MLEQLWFTFCFQSSVYIIDTDFCLWMHHEKSCKLVLHKSVSWYLNKARQSQHPNSRYYEKQFFAHES